jgi:hypothetical protein
MSQLAERVERRRLPRRRTLKSGQVLFDPKAPALDCIVRNLSEHGALLLISPLAVPERFDFLLTSDHVLHRCRVVWRAFDRVGVEFEPIGGTAGGAGRSRS